MNTLYNFPNIPEIADKWIEPLEKPPTENNGKIIGLSTVQRGDYIKEKLMRIDHGVDPDDVMKAVRKDCGLYE